MARKKKAEKDNTERWLLTYSDLMNLLLILFIILYSMSQVNQQKYEALAEGIKESFNSEEQQDAGGQEKNPVDYYWVQDDVNVQKLPDIAADQQKPPYEKDLLKMIKEKNLQKKIEVTVDNRGIVITLKDNFLYTPGSAKMSRDASEIVAQIGYILKRIPYRQIIIEGHTDSDPLNKESPYLDNLGLSSARATNVSRVMIKAGLDPSLISAMGYGEFRPVVPNDTPEHKAKNRRVLITLLRRNFVSNQANVSVKGGG